MGERQLVARAMAVLGRRGGRSTSRAKVAAARRNVAKARMARKGGK